MFSERKKLNKIRNQKQEIYKARKSNSILLNNQQVKEEITMEIRKYYKMRKMKTKCTQNDKMQWKQWSEIYSFKCLH